MVFFFKGPEFVKKPSLFSLLNTEKFDMKKAKEYFQALTFTRSELVTFLNMNTLEGSNSFPCNTLTGLKAGAPCVFPFVYPDCKLAFKSGRCKSNLTNFPETFQRCRVNDDTSACYTRTYHNTSGILGQWGACRPAANCSSSVR